MCTFVPLSDMTLKKLLTPRRLSYVMMLLDFLEQERHLKTFSTMNHADKLPKAMEIIRNHVGFSLGAALVPFPGADLLAVSAVQLNMLRQLAKLYQVGFMDTLGRNLISAVVGGGLARLGASLIKIIPGVGTLIGEVSMPVLSGASTYALGQVVARHFDHGGTLDNLNLKTARANYREEIKTGKSVAQELQQEKPAETTDPMAKLQKLAEWHAAGILTNDEFQQLKARLLQQI